MNNNKRVFYLIIVSISLYFLFSFLAIILDLKWQAFERVNLISELFVRKEKTPEPVDTITTETMEGKQGDEGIANAKNFEVYQYPSLITDFNADTLQPALKGLLQKLYELKTGRRKKVRIAYLGDSMIEGDLLTQTFRELLQKYFGGNGVGFVPITSIVSKFRQTVSSSYSKGWADENFKNSSKNNKLFLSGHLFRSSGDWVKMTDKTIHDSAAIIEKSLLCGPANGSVLINVNDQPLSVFPDKFINRIPLEKSYSPAIKLSVPQNDMPVYGISFESESGIFVDNFTFRGITGVEFGTIDPAFLSAISQENPYDVIIIQYGVNLMFSPKTTDFSWYSKLFLPVLKKLRSSFPNSDFLIVSTADRAFRYGSEYRSAIGIDSLVKLQATMAYETGCGFYNHFATMGGTNSIVSWASQKPSLANTDYIHPNHRGAEVLGNLFFEAVIRDYNKFVSTGKP